MEDSAKIKQDFLISKAQLFDDKELLEDSFKFCAQYSLLIEEYLFRISSHKKFKCTIAACGSFSRRELSPHSDIDVIFIFPEIEGHEESINACVTRFWDSGIEISHTVRQYSDIEKFRDEDLHAFTQFFETRHLLGDRKIYQQWNERLLKALVPDKRESMIYEFFEDNDKRYKKYGGSPKILEPNIKFTAGGLRDIHVVEWMYCFKNNIILSDQNETSQTEKFLSIFKQNMLLSKLQINKLYKSYRLLLHVRNHLHLLVDKKSDRLEFSSQEILGKALEEYGGSWKSFMKHYFIATSVIHRFSKTVLKRFHEQLTGKLSDRLAIKLDEDFTIRGTTISITPNRPLLFQSILRAFYYRGLYHAVFDEYLRSLIIDRVSELEDVSDSIQTSSVFFREIFKLPQNVGKTLTVMNELGVLSLYLPEFLDLIGFFQPGVYHCYTADEHTLVAINNVEDLVGQETHIGRLFNKVRRKDLLFLSILFHDIGKPVSLAGHEIIGGEIASTVMDRLGFEPDEIELVKFLVRHHLTMEQVAFRRNLNDPSTLNQFADLIPTQESLDMLYLLTYADLSAVSPVVWTQWKSDLLHELYSKTEKMIGERLSGEELLSTKAYGIPNSTQQSQDLSVKDHIESINDISYLSHFSIEEINEHVSKIESGLDVEVFFRELSGFTNVTIITRDSPSLLSRLCGAISINDINIHDAKIFTRNDGIIIDSFNITEFRTHKLVDKEKYLKLTNDLELAARNELAIGKEFKKVKSKWKRIENKLLNISAKIKIKFERHEKYTIIDVFAPDKLGLLYQITQALKNLGLSIYFAKISTKEDGVVDSFYILDNRKRKVSSDDYEFIKMELTKTIEEML